MVCWSYKDRWRAEFGLLEIVCWPLFWRFGASQVALVVKNLPANARDIRDMGSIPWLGKSPGGRHSNPLQYFCPENPMDRGARWATVHRVAKCWTWLKQLSTHILDTYMKEKKIQKHSSLLQSKMPLTYWSSLSQKLMVVVVGPPWWSHG